jgi:integrase
MPAAPRPRRTLLAILGLSGLRNQEATVLRRHHLDFTHNRIVVGEAKTEAGRREVQMSPFLRRELVLHLDALPETEPDALLFPTRTARAHSRQNINRTIVHAAVELADRRRAERGGAPLPPAITAHTFRRTYVTPRR